MTSSTGNSDPKLLKYLIKKELIERKNYELFKSVYRVLSNHKNTEIKALLDRYESDINNDLGVKNQENEESEKISTILTFHSTKKSQINIERILDENRGLTKEQKYYFASSLFAKGDIRQQEKSLEIIKKMGYRGIDSYFFEEFENIINFNKSNIFEKIDSVKKVDQYFASILFHYSLYLVEKDISNNMKLVSSNDTSLDFSDMREKAKILTYESIYYSRLKTFILNNVKLNDSEFKKNLIVLLIRHDHPLGAELIDEAFKNKNIRSIMFSSIEQYIYGSAATNLYEDISEHKYTAYREVAWPILPYAKFDKRALAIKTNLWKGFLTKYPWHPGTDDAYFRLAYDQANLKDYRGSIQTLIEYFHMKNMADKSASVYMKVLLVYLLEKEVDSNFNKIKQIYDIPYCITNSNCKLPKQTIVKEILDDEFYMKSIFLNKSQLAVLRVFLEKAERTDDFKRFLLKNINFRKIIRDIVYVKQIYPIYGESDYNNSSYIDEMKSEYDFNYLSNKVSDRTSKMVDEITKLLGNNKWMVFKKRRFY